MKRARMTPKLGESESSFAGLVLLIVLIFIYSFRLQFKFQF